MQEEKESILKEHLQLRGFSIESFINHIHQIKGNEFDIYSLSISNHDLINLIEDFKKEKANINDTQYDVVASVKDEDFLEFKEVKNHYSNYMIDEYSKNKEKNSDELLRSDSHYEKAQLGNDKTLFVGKDKLNVKVLDYFKVNDKDFLSSSYYVYQIECKNFESKVLRRYNDFLWLRNTLVKYYPGIFVPPIPPKSVIDKMLDNDFHQKRVQRFNKFFDHLSSQKLLASSAITKEFLTETDFSEFTRKKNNFQNYEPDSIGFINQIKEASAELGLINSNDQTIYKLKNSLNSGEIILKEIEIELQKLEGDFKNVSLRIANISKLYKNMQTHHSNAAEFYTEYETKYFEKLSDLTKKWSEAYITQTVFIRENLKEHYGFIKTEYEDFSLMIDSYTKIKNTFFNYKADLLAKKEKYFKEGNIDKWDLANEDILNKESFISNRELCMERMLKTDTEKQNKLEMKFHFMNFQVLKEYARLKKYLNVVLTSSNDEMAENNQKFLSDLFFMIKLVTMNI